ncbi:MAG TPA: NAD(P)H-dependent oxidoreductase [Chitinophaga sp.]|uniref:FMN-dependent NADH-azoreductase n=1 Tax=Chitinophaga sp. TaxID=1869181 RepID=UPI002BD6AE6D|nr:NAD(P)H-dependent oxidoreductase [Chitinophaga sp.]HVI45742.1 NAD(P)H-dependent oxidoreductase [Chitinophaga sp.]
MKKVLHVVSSPRGEASNSIRLGNRIIERIESRYPGTTLQVNNVAEHEYGSYKAAYIDALMRRPDGYTPEHTALLRRSDDAVAQVLWADILVISFPLYNFNFPPSLKSWIDHIIRVGITFSYATGKPEGLLKEKQAYLAVASNGVYSEGPMKLFDFAEPYLKHVLGFVGITDVTTYRIEGAGMSEHKDIAVQKGLERVMI